jgi:hypothetical protein
MIIMKPTVQSELAKWIPFNDVLKKKRLLLGMKKINQKYPHATDPRRGDKTDLRQQWFHFQLWWKVIPHLV